MIGLGALVLIALVIAGAVASSRARGDRAGAAPRAAAGVGPASGPAAPSASATGAEPALEAAIARWRAADLITPEQGDAIVAHEREVARRWAAAAAPAAPPPPPPPRRVPLAAEALGYLGGILALVGLGLIVSRYWPDLAIAGRLALSGTTAAALVGAGLAVREEADPALARLRWALWLAGTAAAGLAAGVVADAGDVGSPEGIAVAVAGTVAVLSAAMWRGRDRVVQQATALVAILVTAGAAVALVGPDAAAGLTVWVLAAGLVALGLLRRTTAPLLTQLVGIGGLAVGAGIVASSTAGPGLLFLQATALGVLGLAVGPSPGGHADRTLAAVTGGLLLSQITPGTIGYFAQDAGLATGLATWTTGGVLLLLGLRRLVRGAVVIQIGGCAALLVGAAVTGVQVPGFAPLFGLATALGLLALGTRPAGVLCSLFGSVGLLVNVPWAITRYFPGEGRVPLLILVSGALIIGAALLLARSGDRFRRELRPPPPLPPPPPTPPPARDRPEDVVH